MKNSIQMVLMEGCNNCKEKEKAVRKILKEFSNWEFESISASSEQGKKLMNQLHFTTGPAIIVENELFSTGDFDHDKLINRFRH